MRSALAEALKSKQPVAVHRELCRKEAGAFQASLADPDSSSPARRKRRCSRSSLRRRSRRRAYPFVNIREAGGWSAEGKDARAEDRGPARRGGAARAGAGSRRSITNRAASC